MRALCSTADLGMSRSAMIADPDGWLFFWAVIGAFLLWLTNPGRKNNRF